MKTILKLFVILFSVLTLNSCLAGKFMCKYALTPTPHGIEDIDRTRHKADSLQPGSTAWYDQLQQAGVIKDTTILGYRNNKVYAMYAPAKDPANARGTAVIVHGYGDNHFVFIYLARMYRDDLNYNILMPDLQYHGYSEGDHIQMGWNDRLDVEKWIGVAHDIFQDDFMVVHGVSMGASCVMMLSGDPQPDYVRCYVEDCGYSTVMGQFQHNLKQSFPIIPKDVLNSASIVCKKRYGWSFKEASAIEQLAKCDRPMLFIHGNADDFVSFSNLQQNYDAKVNGYKEMWVTEGSVHANSFARYPEEYKKRVEEFLTRVKGML